MQQSSIISLYQHFIQNPSICTDTRQIQQGDIFFALSGPNFNGNTFATEALEAGASLCVVADETLKHQPGMFWVSDTLIALQQLAKYHRQQFDIPIIAITGSNGKTTTKELLNVVLHSTFTTHTTVGNLNNHIGIPLTLLQLKKDTEIAVIEMGANHQKEIESYCQFTLPTHGIITNCGKAHLEGFGGVEGVRKGKGELFDYLRSMNGTAFVCSDFDYFLPMTKGLDNIIWYGKQKGEVIGLPLPTETFLKALISFSDVTSLNVQTNLVGDYNIYNVMAAVAVGMHFLIPKNKIISAIESYHPENSRSQMIEKNGNHIIMDNYNANPTSMAEAIKNFANLEVPNKILVLGGMAELGESSQSEHEQLIQLINHFQWKEVVLVGTHFKNLNHSYLYFETSEAAAHWWEVNQTTGNYMLLKGSRSMKMEKVIE